MTDFEFQRKILVERMKKSGVIKSTAVESAFLKVLREDFMPLNLIEYSYVDSSFPIGFGQTISQPSTIAVALELLSVEKGNKVLEIGSGCGYVLALLSELAGKKKNVFGVELLPELVDLSRQNLLHAGYNQVTIVCGNGEKGLSSFQPFDRIILSCAASEIPLPLIDQLSDNGLIVAPLGSRFTQELTAFRKQDNKLIEIARKGYFVFVSLRGKFGFKPLR